MIFDPCIVKALPFGGGTIRYRSHPIIPCKEIPPCHRLRFTSPRTGKVDEQVIKSEELGQLIAQRVRIEPLVMIEAIPSQDEPEPTPTSAIVGPSTPPANGPPPQPTITPMVA